MLLQEKLNSLFEMVITKFNVDILGNRIVLEGYLAEADYISHRIDFTRVSCFYFINNTTESRKNIWLPEEDDFLEMTSIYALSELVNIDIESSKDTWLNQYSGSGNIVLEFWSNLLVIEAETIIINGVSYPIDF
ncbi:YxiG family protein [Streptococcus acidominimus]|uniref:Uncharacterized protein n=1 Tax=Streptococcus acidominimus TaxID=1326 RepID=A0A1Q8EEM4_STRAI|nr:hypothetical protein [Streptococcus acidominimus]OLF50223.1 hypothetical protein BU200_02955 [Streptococcus acidominimus]SUN06695.1 Uncharacterised protein [Streptococcus acidominimus]